MEISDVFPYLTRLKSSDFQVTSDSCRSYNCIAHAAGDTKHFWDPLIHWPDGVTRAYTLEAYTECFESLGYQVCDSDELEAGYEKVALYLWNRQPGYFHATRQLVNGRWTSKLGKNVDIEHTLDALVSNHTDGYGEVVKILKRPRQEG